MKSLISIGEALIDFIPEQKGVPLSEVKSFERVCGGAPANVSAAAAKLGFSARMITKLGLDAFGDFIVKTLDDVGVDTSGILRTSEANTALAFVSLKADGERDFSFYRSPSADMLLDESDLKEEWFQDCGVMHFCSVDLIESPMKYAHKKAIELARANKAIISFDPNIRLPLWDSEENCRQTVKEFLPLSDIVKISDEELEFITGIKDTEMAIKSLFVGNIKMVMYSMGKAGARIITKNYDVSHVGPDVEKQDTTGAGDSVIGAFLSKILKNNISRIEEITKDMALDYLKFSNYYASYSVMGKGAIGSYATLKQIDEFIRRYELD